MTVTNAQARINNLIDAVVESSYEASRLMCHLTKESIKEPGTRQIYMDDWEAVEAASRIVKTLSSALNIEVENYGLKRPSQAQEN